MSDKEQVFAKCAWRLIPFMVLLYVINYLDRVNVGFAALTMNSDLGLTPAIYGFGASLFFIGYMVFQVPSVLILERFGARRTVFWILLTWGAVSAANALVQGEASFYLVRFLLGIAEAGFFPGMIFYLTLWFPPAYRARVNAYFYSGIPLAFILGGPLSSLIMEMDGIAGLRGWQWLFIIEGLPACFLAFAALRLLPDGPRQASWLNAEERATIASRVAADDKAEQRSLWPALLDPRVIALGMAYAGWQFGFYGLGLWLPQIIQAMGFSNFANGFITALPFLAAIVAMNLWSRSSDARGERIWHVVIPALVAALGFAAASVSPLRHWRHRRAHGRRVRADQLHAAVPQPAADLPRGHGGRGRDRAGELFRPYRRHAWALCRGATEGGNRRLFRGNDGNGRRPAAGGSHRVWPGALDPAPQARFGAENLSRPALAHAGNAMI